MRRKPLRRSEDMPVPGSKRLYGRIEVCEDLCRGDAVEEHSPAALCFVIGIVDPDRDSMNTQL